MTRIGMKYKYSNPHIASELASERASGGASGEARNSPCAGKKPAASRCRSAAFPAFGIPGSTPGVEENQEENQVVVREPVAAPQDTGAMPVDPALFCSSPLNSEYGLFCARR